MILQIVVEIMVIIMAVILVEIIMAVMTILKMKRIFISVNQAMIQTLALKKIPGSHYQN